MSGVKNIGSNVSELSGVVFHIEWVYPRPHITLNPQNRGGGENPPFKLRPYIGLEINEDVNRAHL